MNPVMKRVLIVACFSLGLAVAMHSVPVAYDSFDLVEVHGRQTKVFPRGWPISYVSEGEMRDQAWLVAFKCFANVTSVFFVVWLLTVGWRKFRTTRQKGAADYDG